MRCSPLASRGNQRACCSGVPASVIGRLPSSWTARIRPVVAHARLSCSTARQTVSRSAAETAVLDRERQGQDVLIGQEAAQVLGELAGPVDLGGPGRHLLVGQDADGVAEHELLLGESRGRCHGRHRTAARRRPGLDGVGYATVSRRAAARGSGSSRRRGLAWINRPSCSP